ncbi:MAG: hypothetical protein AB7I38_02940 [Dehalococcoidia bacterium]
MSRSNIARIALALIRLVNGTIALVQPRIITGRFAAPGEAEPPQVAVYALRMFGIRTVLIALDLLRRDGPSRRHAVAAAPLIHASDTATAILVARSGLVPQSTGRLIVTISAINTLLSLLMQQRATNGK